MPRMLSTVAAALALLAAPAFAQTPPNGGTGNEPLSKVPTNVTPSDTHTQWSPRLPTPPVSEDAPPLAFLKAAHNALVINQTGEAQEALERAESRALDRSIRPSKAGQPSRQPLVQQIAQARQALAAGDRGRAMQLVDAAMKNPDARERD